MCAKRKVAKIMKSSLFIIGALMVSGLLLAQVPVFAGVGQVSGGTLPVSQPLVREGTLAVKLVDALQLGSAAGEAESEGMLAAVGIAPRNGWIADYPVTPDIVGELQQAIGDAADSERIAMGRTDALKAFADVMAAYDLSIAPSAADQNVGDAASSGSPDSTIINNYYYNEGPPVVTYYAPPPAYSYLYAWVPYPFWWWDFWFPGFFILTDFHRTVFVDGRVRFCSNHFFDSVGHRVVRIDAVSRFHGRSFAGAEFSGKRDFGSAGMSRGSSAAFAGNRNSTVTGTGKAAPSGGARTMNGASSGYGKSVVSPNQGRTFGSPSMDGRMVAPSRGGRASDAPFVNNRASSPPSDRGREFNAPSVSRRSFVSPSAGSRAFGSPTYERKTVVSPSGSAGTFRTPSVQNRAFAPSSGGVRTYYSAPAFSGGRTLGQKGGGGGSFRGFAGR